MKLKFAFRIRIYTILLFSLCAASGLKASDTDSEELYVFNKSKIHVEGVMSPFEATVDIKELGLHKFVLNIYLHSAYAAAPPAFNVSIKFPKDKINQLWNSKTWSMPVEPAWGQLS